MRNFLFAFFSERFKHLLLPDISFGFISRNKKKSEVKISFNFLVNFWTTAYENASMAWNVAHDRISIFYYFNDENIDLEQILSLLNNFDESDGLHIRCWKLPLVLQVSNSEHWNYDYFKSVEFIVRRWFSFIFSSINLKKINLKEYFC